MGRQALVLSLFVWWFWIPSGHHHNHNGGNQNANVATSATTKVHSVINAGSSNHVVINQH